MKKLLIGTAVAMACGSVSVAHAAATIQFDINGTAAGGLHAVDAFDWIAGNGLVIGAFSNPLTDPGGGLPPFVTSQVVAQSNLGVFTRPGDTPISPDAGSEFTFQASFFENAVGLGTATAGFTTGVGVSSFEVFYDTNAATFANHITGTGFGDGLSILRGTLTSLSGNFTDTTIAFGDAIDDLDLLNAENQNSVQSHRGNGSTTIRIDVSFADTDFFKSSITSLLIDLQDVSGNNLPFEQQDPSDSILGFTPFYTVSGGLAVNGAGATDCAANGSVDENGNVGTRCDLHLQTDGISSFNPVPEPGSLALMGLGMGALGMLRRRKAKAA